MAINCRPLLRLPRTTSNSIVYDPIAASSALCSLIAYDWPRFASSNLGLSYFYLAEAPLCSAALLVGLIMAPLLHYGI